MATERQCAVVLELFETSFERVYGFLRRSLDPEAAEELTQEVFARVLSLQDFDTKEVTVSYLIKIADNLLKRRHKRIVQRRRIEADLCQAARPRLSARDSRQPDSADESPRLAAAMRRLSPQERDAVRLTVCEGLSYEDVARSMGVQVSTVNNWKHRGIQKLKHHVGADRPGDDARPIARALRARLHARSLTA
jgi:RNA polymerase sigma-70 factor (ECF subfamily)